MTSKYCTEDWVSYSELHTHRHCVLSQAAEQFILIQGDVSNFSIPQQAGISGQLNYLQMISI